MTSRTPRISLAITVLACMFINAGWTITILFIVGFVAAMAYGYVWVKRLITRACMTGQLIVNGNVGNHVKPSSHPARHGR